MIVGAQQMVGKQRIPVIEGRAPRLSQPRNIGYVVGSPLPEPVAEQRGTAGKQPQPQTFGFLLVMAALSGARDFGIWALGDLLRTYVGVAVDPSVQSIVLQLIVSVAGIGVAAGFSKGTSDPAARRHMLVTLLAATGIGLILALLSYLVGYTKSLFWLLVPVYLFWAWAEAVSGSSVPVANAQSAHA